MAAQTNNIVMFPKNKKDTVPQNQEELLKVIENTRKSVAEIIIEEVVNNMFQNMSRYNITVKEKNSLPFMKDIGMIVESIRSGVYRSLEYSHVFHPISEKIFELKSENEVKLNIDLLIDKEEKEVS